jgi:tetratricopeptide (TPR) repeat protein
MPRLRLFGRVVVFPLPLLLGALALLACPGVLHAQADPAEPAHPTPGGADPEARDAEAQARFESGRLAFDDGRFEDALRDFEQSFALSQRPQLLYNMGQVHDRLRHPAEAVAYFERYLEALPDAENRRAVEARVHLLRAERDAGETRDTETGVDAPHQPGPLRFTWVAMGVGAASAVAGVALAVKTRRTYDDLEAGCGASGGCTQQEINRSGGPRQQRTSRALLGLAGGALALGAVLVVVERGRGRPSDEASPGASARTTRVSVGPTGLLVEGTF